MSSDRKYFVTKTFLPPKEEYLCYIDEIWESGQLTNGGPLLKRFEDEAQEYLGVDNFQFVGNGTLALQLAIDGLGITEGEIITTPFSYVATTSAILWQRCVPVYVDIEPDTLCIDTTKIEAAITPKTKAILAVHVFGNACDVEGIEEIAQKHKLKVIYDGAHAFGVKYKGKPLLSYGDVSIVSFHATKLFHTIEGGGIVCREEAVYDLIDQKKRFGHTGDDHNVLGINAKASEFQAAMGLANLRYVDEVIKKRKSVTTTYDNLLEGSSIIRKKPRNDLEYNYSYYPVLFASEGELLSAFSRLAQRGVVPRRYFYPALNTLPYLDKAAACPIAEDISLRVACLPLYADLEEPVVLSVCDTLKEAL